MHLIASMRLFNEAMPAVTPTALDVVLWLLLLLAKTMLLIFIFESAVHGHHTYKRLLQ